jgi:ABC-type multidrug transport system permease subunit
VVLDILGNTFAKIQIKSLYYEHQMYFWIVIAAILVIYAPAYYGTYRYAYQE